MAGGGGVVKVMTTSNIVAVSMNHYSCLEKKPHKILKNLVVSFQNNQVNLIFITKANISHVKSRHFYDIPTVTTLPLMVKDAKNWFSR